MDKLRIDKWLWAARFYKTRSLATEEIHKGRIHVNGQEAKPARELRAGDSVELRQKSGSRTVVVQSLSDQRGGAPVAQQMYAETAESMQQRATAVEQKRMGIEPGLTHKGGRPDKHERRAVQDAWGERWSASLD